MIHPEWYSTVVRSVSSLGGEPAAATTLAQNQARFVNLDGKVEIKKANSVIWGIADYRSTLDKGDLVRTELRHSSKNCDDPHPFRTWPWLRNLLPHLL